MIAAHTRQVRAPYRPLALLKQSWQRNWSLTLIGVLMILTLIGSAVGLLVDPRVITGAPAWMKPAKFAISVSIYTFTLVWLLQYVQGHPRLVRFASTVTSLVLGIEMVIVVLQALRGAASHFNVATPFDGMLFSIMGASITVLWLVAFMEVILILRQKLPDPVVAWSLRLALVLSLLGMTVAFLMVSRPSPAQRARLAAGYRLTTKGAHSVGVEDGGPGLPLVGWSTIGGDLRIPHFVGLHALQILPLAGLLIGRCARRLRIGKQQQVRLLLLFGVAYGLWMGLLTWQALRGQSIIAPDSLTLAAYGALLAAGVVAAGAVVTLDLPRRGRVLSLR